MKLRDLIEELQRHDPDLDVRVLASGAHGLAANEVVGCVRRRVYHGFGGSDRTYLLIETEPE